MAGMVLVLGGGLTTGSVYDISLLLFFVALPIANALLDWPSWWVSRWLGQHLLKIVSRKAASSANPGGSFACSDRRGFARPRPDRPRSAVLCLWGLAVLLPFLIELFNLWSAAHGNPKPLALRPFLNQAVQQPWPNGMWVLAMLLSTLVPTLLHAMALVASPVMVWLGSSDRREQIAVGLTAKKPDARGDPGAAWHMTWTWLIGITAPLLMLAAFVWLIGVFWRPVGDLLLGAALDGMGWALSLALALGWPVP